MASPLTELLGLDPATLVKYGARAARRRAVRQQLLAAAGLPTDIRELTPEQLHSFREGGSGLTKGLGFPNHAAMLQQRAEAAGGHADRTAMLTGGPKPAGVVPGRPAGTPDAATLAELMRRLSSQFR